MHMKYILNIYYGLIYIIIRKIFIFSFFFRIFYINLMGFEFFFFQVLHKKLLLKSIFIITLLSLSSFIRQILFYMTGNLQSYLQNIRKLHN